MMSLIPIPLFLEKAIGTKIEWYPGKCLTQKLLKKKSRRGGKIIIKTEKCDSFFNFFNPPQVPEYGDDIDEDAAEDLQNELDMDYEIGTYARNKGRQATRIMVNCSCSDDSNALEFRNVSAAFAQPHADHLYASGLELDGAFLAIPSTELFNKVISQQEVSTG